MNTNRLFGIAAIFVGAFFLVVAITFNLALNTPHAAGSQVLGVSLLGAVIPVATAILLEDICLVIGIALAIIGAIIVLFGSSGVRIKPVKRVEPAVCGNCGATVPGDATRCPSCSVEFGEQR